MNSKKFYDKPPLIEALCEFQFIPSKPWDMTIPGLFYGKIQENFPEKQQRLGLSLKLQRGEKDNVLEQNVQQQMQFFRKDKSALVQIGPDFLSVNQLRPYPTWQNFNPVILENLRIYNEIANPSGFKRIGLRYINKVDIEKANVALEQYFNFYPSVPPGLSKIRSGINVRIEIPYDKSNKLILTLATLIPEKPGMISILLDIDYIADIPGCLPIDQAPSWIEQAHEKIEEAFEACITDESRILFEEKK